MEIDPVNLKRAEAYNLMCSVVVPRPIAWVSTVSAEGRPNLAPFSFFNAVTSDPPTLMLSVGRRRGGRKDTSANLLSVKEGVVHIPSRANAEQMVATSADFESGIDEFSACGLTSIPANLVKPQRIKGALLAMEVKVSGHHEVGNAPMDVFYLEVLRFHVAEEIMTEGRVDANKLDACGRLGGSEYCVTTELFNIARRSPEDVLVDETLKGE